MSWSYDNTLPTKKDKIRALVGDTDSSNQLVTDEQIEEIALKQDSNLFGAASIVARMIHASFGNEVTRRVADLSVDLSDKADNYNQLAEKYEDKKKQGYDANAFKDMSIAVSEDSKDDLDDDEDLVQPRFTRDQHEM